MKEFFLKTDVPHDCPDDVRQLLIDEMKSTLPYNSNYKGSIGLGMFSGTTVAIIYTMEPDDDNYEKETGDYYERQTSWDNRD